MNCKPLIAINGVLHNNISSINIWFINVDLQRFKDIECSHLWSLEYPHFEPFISLIRLM